MAKDNKFLQVSDEQGEIPNLYLRKGIYYGKLKGFHTKFRALVGERGPVTEIGEARQALAVLLEAHEEARTVIPHSPRLEDYARHYITWLHGTRAKSPASIKKEFDLLRSWTQLFGTVRLLDLTPAHVNQYAAERSRVAGNSNINHGVRVLTGLMDFAKRERVIPLRADIATDGWVPLVVPKVRRGLVTEEVLNQVLDELLRTVNGKPVYPHGQVAHDWVRFMAYTGARRTSAMNARWEFVDWENRQVVLTEVKGGRTDVVVDFNHNLENLLREMFARRTSDYLFPSPDRTPGRVALNAFSLATTKLGIEDFSPHALRHYFISWCVMSGVDTMTIARWVGHSDGGILIGKVYGHLNREHTQRAAQKVVFSVSPGGEPKPGEPASPCLE